MSGAEDPGWRPALRPAWRSLVPWLPFWWRRIDLDLTGLRRIFLHTAVALIELTIAMQWTFEAGARRTRALPWILLGLGTAWALGGLIWSHRTPLATGSAEALAGQFRSLSFIRLGLAAAPALWGIAGAYLADTAALSVAGTAAEHLALRRLRADAVPDRSYRGAAPGLGLPALVDRGAGQTRGRAHVRAREASWLR